MRKIKINMLLVFCKMSKGVLCKTPWKVGFMIPSLSCSHSTFRLQKYNKKVSCLFKCSLGKNESNPLIFIFLLLLKQNRTAAMFQQFNSKSVHIFDISSLRKVKIDIDFCSNITEIGWIPWSDRRSKHKKHFSCLASYCQIVSTDFLIEMNLLTDFQKVGILGSRIPDIIFEKSGHIWPWSKIWPFF